MQAAAGAAGDSSEAGVHRSDVGGTTKVGGPREPSRLDVDFDRSFPAFSYGCPAALRFPTHIAPSPPPFLFVRSIQPDAFIWVLVTTS